MLYKFLINYFNIHCIDNICTLYYVDPINIFLKQFFSKSIAYLSLKQKSFRQTNITKSAKRLLSWG